MRPWKVYSLCATALFVVAGLLIAQEQGPIRNPGTTVARPRKPADEDEKKGGEDSTLPKIPSQYSKKDKPDVENLQVFSTNVDVVTLDVAVMDNKGHFI